MFEADCRCAAAVDWPAHETPIRFSAREPLAAQWVEQLLAVRRHDGEYVADVRAGKAEGVVVVVDGRIVHSAYLMFGNKTACLLGFGRGVGLLGNAHTDDAYRGRGCQARSARERVAMARAAGLDRVISETACDNVASQRGLEKAGLTPVGRVRFAVLLNTLVLRTRRPRASIARVAVCI